MKGEGEAEGGNTSTLESVKGAFHFLLFTYIFVVVFMVLLLIVIT